MKWERGERGSGRGVKGARWRVRRHSERYRELALEWGILFECREPRGSNVTLELSTVANLGREERDGA
jgi:hypothetical protein